MPANRPIDRPPTVRAGKGKGQSATGTAVLYHKSYACTYDSYLTYCIATDHVSANEYNMCWLRVVNDHLSALLVIARGRLP